MGKNENNNGRRPYYRKRNSYRGPKVQEKVERAPHPQFATVAQLEKALEENLSEKNLVRSIAIAWNKYAWYDENEEKCASDEIKYADACINTDIWCECYYRLIEKLKSFLGIDSDTVFALPELTVYMNKFGFEDTEGLWTMADKKQKKTTDDNQKTASEEKQNNRT